MRGLTGGRTDECRGDLLARERKGQLSGSDCLALRAHLSECGSCRLARQVFVDLEDVSGVDLRDGVRIERMSMAARRWSHQRSRSYTRLSKSRPRLRALMLGGLLLILVGGSASATAWWWRHVPVVQSVPALTVDPVAVRRASVDPAPVGPARLLREASDVRRAGDAERAIDLYRKLQQQFSRSPEAVVSAVPLGGLLLDRRLPQAALAQFDSYLGSSRGGVLIPEALYGRGRALSSLGDRKEERQTWDRLLADFPDSTYGPTARRRLAELK